MSASTQQREFLTRAEIPEFLAQHGYPLGRSTIDKLSMPSCGEHAGPKPARTLGDRTCTDPSRCCYGRGADFVRCPRSPVMLGHGVTAKWGALSIS